MDYQQKIIIRGEKNVDKIRPFQIDEKNSPEKIHGSKKKKIREALHAFISLMMKTKSTKEGTLCRR
jgi:hypothetical protein